MISAELYSQDRPLVIVERSDDANLGAWARLQEALARGVVGGSTLRMEVRVDVFLSELMVLREVRSLFQEQVEFGPGMKAQLSRLAQDKLARERALSEPASQVDLKVLARYLDGAGFKRPLKPFQIANLAVINRLPHAADFSVPGAGKTTVALANFAILRSKGQITRLLVVAPLAAFASWKEDSQICISPAPKVVVHTGPDSLIPDNTDILLTNYNRLAADYDRIREFVSQSPTQVILDEAHRIKRGALGVWGRTVLDLAFAAARRDVLTGTPAPQGAYDLIAPMRFLYPGQDRQILPAGAYVEGDGRDDHVLKSTSQAIRNYFVRTPKSQLDLPPTAFDVIRRPMHPIQRAIYDALLGKFRASFSQTKASKREFARLGRIVMYLLEGATNPMLLSAGSDQCDEVGFAHPPLEISGNEPLMDLLSSYRQYEVPWKYAEIESKVEEAARNHEKVLIWSTFVRNLRVLSKHLERFKPAMVHGGVPPEETAQANQITREAELERFREDAGCSVLLANPAAMGEGVSLHHWCHHAIYLDRTFNAGQFLQSQDRIHRLGLEKGILTRFTILVSEDTIDESVDGRLREKVIALGHLMDDPGLVQVALPEPDEGVTDPPVYEDDVDAVLSHIGKTSHAA